VRAKYAAIEAAERRLARTMVRAAAPRAGAPGDEPARAAASAAPGEPADATAGTAAGAATGAAVTATDSPGRALEAEGVAIALPRAWAECLEVRVKYRGYIERERRAAARAAALEDLCLPDGLWASPLTGLSREAAEKLARWRPVTVGQAGRIAGVSPSDVAVLMVHARRLAAAARPVAAEAAAPVPERASRAPAS